VHTSKNYSGKNLHNAVFIPTLSLCPDPQVARHEDESAIDGATNVGHPVGCLAKPHEYYLLEDQPGGGVFICSCCGCCCCCCRLTIGA
jgi:hypothetical protein